MGILQYGIEYKELRFTYFGNQHSLLLDVDNRTLQWK